MLILQLCKYKPKSEGTCNPYQDRIQGEVAISIQMSFQVHNRVVVTQRKTSRYKRSNISASVPRRVCKMAKKDYQVRHVCLSFRTEQIAETGRIYVKLDIWEFFEERSRKFKFHYNVTRITGTLHEHIITFMIISRGIFVE